MKIDAPLLGCPLSAAAGLARAHADAGFDGVFTFDGPFEPFASLALAATSTPLSIATGVAIAFARSPMTVAQSAHDLQLLSGGRFALGLGSQVRAHVEERFSMPWGRPVARMKEFVAALRAILACWNDDVPLAFRGEFYRFTRMPPLLRPAPCPHGAPPVLVAGVGRAMLEAAGETADGCVLHPFHSAAWIDEVALPALAAGRARATVERPFEVHAQVLVVTGADEAETAAAREAVRAQLAFYASTPAYRGVLDVHGRGALQGELHALVRQGRWDAIGGLVDDGMVERHAVVGSPREAGRELRRRYEGRAVRVALATPMLPSPATASALVQGFREG